MSGKDIASQTITEGELIYEATIRFTNVIDYGVCMEALSTGEIVPPPEGARFDYVFQGDVQGPRLNGKITGTDHLCVRADGLFQLHIHAQIRTADGHNISFSSEGISTQIEGAKETELRAAVSLFSSSPEYKWVNKLQLWAKGSLDPGRGQAFVRAYAA